MKRLLLAVAILALATWGGVAYAAGAKSKKDSGVVYAAVVHQVGKSQIADGDLKDKVLGAGAITYVITVSSGPPQAPSTSVTIKASRITVFTADGSLSGTGSAVQSINADGTGNVTGGKFTLTKGTGGLKGHRLTGTFSGPFNGTFYTFTYKGTYK